MVGVLKINFRHVEMYSQLFVKYVYNSEMYSCNIHKTCFNNQNNAAFYITFLHL